MASTEIFMSREWLLFCPSDQILLNDNMTFLKFSQKIKVPRECIFIMVGLTDRSSELVPIGETK